MPPIKTHEKLEALLRRIDGRGYKAYRDIQGAFQFPRFQLYIDHVQGDPFATPSRLRLRVSQEQAQLPADLYQNPVRRMATCDFLARQFQKQARRFHGKVRGTGNSGTIFVDAGGQAVLERTACRVNERFVEMRIQVGLPAAGRTILGKEAARLLLEFLPWLVDASMRWEALPGQEMRAFVDCVENQEYLRSLLPRYGLVAFVANGAILPRRSGISQLPMATTKAISFRSPTTLEVELPLKHALPNSAQKSVRGMGIPRGVTLIVGGGYHGKSTLLNALEHAVYPHIPGDGREYVVCLPRTVKIRAEDGRRVEKVDISPFINNLPFGQSTEQFCTEDASGSTSQAANIMEALEAGGEVLLVDEDTSATNFMIRDARMQRLVTKDREPITPFLDRVGELYQRFGVSTVLVMGGSGDYLEEAHTVIRMNEFLPEEVTEQAREIARQFPVQRKKEALFPMKQVVPRCPLPESIDPSRGRKPVKIEARGLDELQFGRTTIELRAVEQIVDVSQTRAIGQALWYMKEHWMDGQKSVAELLALLKKHLDERGLDILSLSANRDQHPGNLARPRELEIAAALNRLRTLRVVQKQEKGS